MKLPLRSFVNARICEGKRCSLFFQLILVILTSSSFSGCEPLFIGSEELDVDPPRFKASEITPPTGEGKQLRVMAWNIKYGALRAPFWFDCWGDQVSLSRDQVEQNMEQIYEMIREADPDILMIEELELHSRRSAYYDMLQGILEHTQLNYGAYFETWNSRYIPSEGLGRMSLGNAIFTKHEMTKAEKIAQIDRSDLDPVTQPFYLHRFMGRVELKLPSGSSVAAYVVHTEAYDEDGTKAKQIKQIFDQVSDETLPFVLGGDFNELPPTSAQIDSFPDERSLPVCGADFDQPPYTPEVMSEFFVALKPWISLEQYGDTQKAQSRFFTHSVLGPQESNEEGEQGEWNRTLDYLFASPNTQWVEGSTDVLQRRGQRVGVYVNSREDREQVGPLDWILSSDPLSLSDHAPVFGIWEVNP